MLDVNNLLELADEEARAPRAGRPRQVNLRRAISTAYYAVFHELLRSVATQFVAAAHWKSQVLFYRALEHAKTRDRCKRLGKSPLADEEAIFFGWQSFPTELRQFTGEFVTLQELRHEADYDPEVRFTIQETRAAMATARKAVATLRNASDEYLKPFLSYLLFGLRR